MKSLHLLALLAALTTALTMPRAQACVSEHGTEPLGGSGWSAPLTEIVNDKARVSGRVGPLAPSAYFEYKGDLDAFQRVLAKYAALPQPDHILYLRTSLAVESDFQLSISHDGHGYLHLNVGSQISLDKLKVPAGVAVEALSGAPVPNDPGLKTQQQAEQKRIDDFVAAHKARQPPVTGTRKR